LKWSELEREGGSVREKGCKTSFQISKTQNHGAFLFPWIGS